MPARALQADRLVLSSGTMLTETRPGQTAPPGITKGHGMVRRNGNKEGACQNQKTFQIYTVPLFV